MAAERKAVRPVTGQRRLPDKEVGWSVEFKIDSTLRVTDAEVQALETYLGKQLDALFEGKHSSRNDTVGFGEEMNPPMRKQG